MTDRELLELHRAAKAAGLRVKWEDVHDCYWLVTEQGMPIKTWEPLTDDGDALRLAVKLHLTLRCYMGTTTAQRGVPGERCAYVDETNTADPAAATRRAIVRAAAAIGSSGEREGETK